MPASEVQTITRQLLAALEYVHGQSVIHSDVKPENILVTKKKGALKVTLIDFGSALFTSDPRPIMAGTAPYRLRFRHTLSHTQARTARTHARTHTHVHTHTHTHSRFSILKAIGIPSPPRHSRTLALALLPVFVGPCVCVCARACVTLLSACVNTQHTSVYRTLESTLQAEQSCCV